MADTSGTGDQPAHGFEAIKRHTMENKLEVSMWAIRASAILFTFAYFIPIIG